MQTIINPILVADEGKMLFNGQTYSERVYVGAADSVENWQEVPYEQYEQWLAEQEKLRTEYQKMKSEKSENDL